MARSLVFRIVITGLAFVVGVAFAYGVFEASRYASNETKEVETRDENDPITLGAALPDPLARRSTPTRSLAFVAFLLVVSVGVFWLGRRRALEPEEEIQEDPQGPRLIFARELRSRRRSPEFYEELRRRENKLESLESKGPERQRRKVIELPVGDHDSMADDRQPGR